MQQFIQIGNRVINPSQVSIAKYVPSLPNDDCGPTLVLTCGGTVAKVEGPDATMLWEYLSAAVNCRQLSTKKQPVGAAGMTGMGT